MIFFQPFLNQTVFGLEPVTPNFIYLSSTAGIQVGDTIEIMLDNGEFFRTTVTLVSSSKNAITIANALPNRATAGNIVIDITQSVTVAPSRAELSTDLGG